MNNKISFVPDLLSDSELAKCLVENFPGKVIETLFEFYPIDCVNMQSLALADFDNMIAEFNKTENHIPTLTKIISLTRSVLESDESNTPITERIKDVLRQNITKDLTTSEIAEKAGVSRYYMLHHFKKQTGKTITDYKNEIKIQESTRLIRDTDMSFSEITAACGFCSQSYFAEVFSQYEKISPSVYRKYLKQTLEEKNNCEAYELAYDKAKILFNMLPNKKLLYGIKLSGLKTRPEVCRDYEVFHPTEEFGFLHEAAIMKFNGKLFAAWYNSGVYELLGRTPIQFSVSSDDGKTWSKPKIVADDKTSKILFCPPVFGIDDGKLYMFINEMVSADHMHALDLYIYNENSDTFEMLWSRPIPFKLNTNVYKLSNGKLMLPGRIAEMDGFPNTPAVLISDSGRIDAEWRLVKIAENGDLPNGEAFIHPELCAIINGETVYILSRNDNGSFPILYVSEDNCETWSEAFSVDMPLSDTKIYSGTLSDGRNYIVANTYPGREKLVILLSKPGTMEFNDGFVLQDGFSEKFGYGSCWHYPVAYEADGKLYVIYTANVDSWIVRGAVITVIDIDKI